MKIVLFFLAFAFAMSGTFAQDFSNKGKDFWLGYGYHVRFVTGNPENGQEMVLYFATENVPGRTTNIRIEIPAVGYVETINNVAPGTIVTSQPIPKFGFQDARLITEGAFSTGIHVTSDRPVVAYTHIYNGNVSGASILFPTNTLGKEYYSINYTQNSNEDASNSFFFVVAADTGITTVEITPSENTLLHAANVPFTVTLGQGDIYNVMGQLTGGSPGNYTGVDLTGSRIRSISTNGSACKKIAVYSGSGKIKIACGGNANSSDNLFAQAFPKIAWGKKFLTTPTQSLPNNYFRIAVSDPAAVVKVNGAAITGLINNFYYDLPLTSDPLLVESDQQIMVAQYVTTTGTCGNNAGQSGDPEMIYLSPVEQTIDEVILNSTPNAAISAHWINVVIKSLAVPSFTISGAISTPVFVQHPQDPTYSYAQIKVFQGAHTMSADSGFNAIAYGYGAYESYGYNAGTNLKDLYNFIEPLNPLNISGTNAACACTPFFLTVTYPFQPTSLNWDFKGFQTPNVLVNNPAADSTYFINGKQVWRYKLPTAFNYCPAGNYPISITAGTPGADGCGNSQIKDDTLLIRNTPAPNFSWVNNGCVSDSVRFKDATEYEDGVNAYQWTWDFGDGATSTQSNPAHKYAAAGTYQVKFSIVTNIGCISSVTTRTVIISELPVANFGISNPLCVGQPITFSDSSTILAPGTIGRWIWDYGDGSSETLLSSTNPLHSYSTTGTQTTTLRIETASGCSSLPFSKTFGINPNPVVDFTLPAGICLPYEVARFTDQTTIADRSEASFTWQWKFGEPSSGARDSANSKNPDHLYGSTGPFNVSLRVTSAAGCTGFSTKPFTNIYPKPSAGFNVTAENCLGAATAFSSTGNGQGNTIANWFWNFGDASLTGTGQTISHTYANAGPFTSTHWIQTDKGCLSDTVSNTVVVNSLPVANFAFSLPACEKNNITITDLSTPGAGIISQWTWNFGNGGADSLFTNNQPIGFQYDTTGIYTVELNLLTDKGCRNPATVSKTITIHPLPKPGFISPEVCLSDASAIFIDTSSIASGSITGWSWNFGDPGSLGNNVSALSNPGHRYNAVGDYTTRLTLTSNNGCRDSLFQSFKVNGDIPRANFTMPAAICAYDSIEIIDSSSVNFGNVTRVEIYWDLVNSPTIFEVDELPAFEKSYRHLYASFQTPLTKDIFIRYKSYSGATCVDVVTKKLTLHAVPILQFGAIPPVCLDAVSYLLTEASETSGMPGTGVFSGTAVSSNGLFSPAVAGVGNFPVLYTYRSAFGCKDTISQIIKVLEPAVANFGYGNPSCEKNAITFTDSSTILAASGTIVNRSWNFGDGSPVVNSNNSAPLSHVFATTSTYTVTLTLTTSNGCAVSRQRQVAINPLPVPGFTFPASSCLPAANVTFSDVSSIADGTANALTYLWNFDDPLSGNNTSRAKNPSHIFTVNRVYNITLVATSGNGCKDSISIPMNTLHPQPTANFTADSASICANQSVQFSDASTGADGTVTSWTWNFGNGNTQIGQIPALQTYTNANTYAIQLSVENSFGCKADTSKSFLVYGNPVVNAGPDKVLLEGGEVTLESSVTGNGLQFLWSPPVFLNNNRVARPLVKGLNQDEIVYTLQVIASGGCRQQDQVKVTLLKSPVIPNTFTPNGDNINDFWTIQYLDSYPDCNIKVFNRDGQSVYEVLGYSAPGWDGKYKGKTLPFGTYYYIIEPGSGRKPITGYVTLLY